MVLYEQKTLQTPLQFLVFLAFCPKMAKIVRVSIAATLTILGHF
jgi:hypothetical protein